MFPSAVRFQIVALCAVLFVSAAPQAAHAWGNEGHRMINRLAASNLPADVPAFMKTPAALNEIEYLGPEPDRWRGKAEPELEKAQAPEHFIDFELADALGALPRNRLDFEAKVFAAGQRPEKIGLQPWQTNEVWERLKAAMRQYRGMAKAGEDTKPVEAAILFYCGWLGHYVGDGAQPLHASVQYNGWTGPNPNGYTTAHKIHWLFESEYVISSGVAAADVEPKMTAAKAIDGDIFDAYVAYLRHTGTSVEKVYALEKAGALVGKGTPEAKDFEAERLAAGASMLRDMIYSAWIDSAVPVDNTYSDN